MRFALRAFMRRLVTGGIWLAACYSFFILAGCMGVPHDSSLPQSRLSEAPRDWPTCVAAVAAKPEYAQLESKLYLGSDQNYPAAYLTNKSFPNQTERELLAPLRDDLRECRPLELARAEPNARKVVTDAHTAEDKVWADGEAGRLPWGALNARRKMIAERKLAPPSGSSPARAKPAEAGAPRRKPGMFDIEPETPSSVSDLPWADRFRTTPKVDTTKILRPPPGSGVYCDNFSSSAACSNIRR